MQDLAQQSCANVQFCCCLQLESKCFDFSLEPRFPVATNVSSKDVSTPFSFFFFTVSCFHPVELMLRSVHPYRGRAFLTLRALRERRQRYTKVVSN